MLGYHAYSQEGMEAVDLGLSVKWATCNIGASTPEEMGNAYAWGEIETKSEYEESNYKFAKPGSIYGGQILYYTITKYTRHLSWESQKNADITTLEKCDDVAYQMLGGNWRMPTINEWIELKQMCKCIRTKMNGTIGYKVIGPNGNSIFFPERDGFYWSSSIEYLPNYEDRDDAKTAKCVSFHGGFFSVNDICMRCKDGVVRPVMEK